MTRGNHIPNSFSGCDVPMNKTTNMAEKVTIRMKGNTKSELCLSRGSKGQCVQE